MSAITALAAAPSADVDAAPATFLSNFRSNQSSVFWNLVWHCADIKAPLEFVLPGISVQLSSAKDDTALRTPVSVDAQAAVAAMSSPDSDERNSFIPTISLLEFEQDSQKTRKQPQNREQPEERSTGGSTSTRAPTKPLPLPPANVKSSLDAPAKSLPPLPSAAAPAEGAPQ
jgi:hypothetical protein